MCLRQSFLEQKMYFSKPTSKKIAGRMRNSKFATWPGIARLQSISEAFRHEEQRIQKNAVKSGEFKAYQQYHLRRQRLRNRQLEIENLKDRVRQRENTTRKNVMVFSLPK